MPIRHWIRLHPSGGWDVPGVLPWMRLGPQCSPVPHRGVWGARCRRCHRGHQPGRGARIPAPPAHTATTTSMRASTPALHPKFPAVPNPNSAPSAGSLGGPCEMAWGCCHPRCCGAGLALSGVRRETPESCSSQEGSSAVPAANADLAPAALPALGSGEGQVAPHRRPCVRALCLRPPGFAAGWRGGSTPGCRYPPGTLRWEAGLASRGGCGCCSPMGRWLQC